VSGALRRLLPYTTVAMLIAMLYAGWTIWSRHAENEKLVRDANEAAVKRDAQVLKIYGGNDLKILLFYASPAAIHRGGKALLCYGVENARKVAIDPPVENTGPALSRCIEAHPLSTTTYTLTAEDASGHRLTQSATLRVSGR
jgi:hypothetical protein